MSKDWWICLWTGSVTLGATLLVTTSVMAVEDKEAQSTTPEESIANTEQKIVPEESIAEPPTSSVEIPLAQPIQVVELPVAELTNPDEVTAPFSANSQRRSTGDAAIPDQTKPASNAQQVATDEVTAPFSANSQRRSTGDSLSQVTSVSQLSDVQPTDWAFQALQSLVERYGCIVGYPDGTYRGNRALTRYEFAAGLNACLDRVNELIATATSGLVTREDLATLQRLQSEFSAELATLRGRTDALEAQTAQLEANQFSTTTKLVGEIAFTVADTFGENDNTQTVLHDKIRLTFVTSFTGKDNLFTRLTAGNLGNSFADEIGSNEGRFAYDGFDGNDVTVDRLHYFFPITDQLRAFVFASLSGHHFYADTFNPGLDVGGGSNGALSRFAERNPIYRFGLNGQGVGLRYQLSEQIQLAAGYLVRGGDDPAQKAGLFDGNYSALGQLVWQPTDSFKIGFTYLNSYDVGVGRRFAFGGTGTNLGNLSPVALAAATGLPQNVVTTPVSSNSYGIEALLQITSKFSLRGSVGLTKARLIGLGDADIWNYAAILAFQDVGTEGSILAIIAGVEPTLRGLEVPGSQNFSRDFAYHLETFYKYQLTDNLSITPGVIWLPSVNQDSNNADVFIGALRTTFTF